MSGGSKIARALVALVAALMIGVGLNKIKTNNPSWHEGEEWEQFLSMYDDESLQLFADCDSRLVENRFGSTQVHACGDPRNPAVFLFHGAADCSLMWGDWLVPELQKTNYAISIDTICDIGRSRPKDSDTANCPKGQEEIGEWAMDIKSQLGIDKPVSLIGYSYGSFLSSQVAVAMPRDVNKLVLLAPAATFADFETGWLMRAIAFNLFGSFVESTHLTTWFFRYMQPDECATTFDTMVKLKHTQWDLRIQADKAGRPTLMQTPHVLSIQTLDEMNKATPTLLIIGTLETVTDPKKAVENAMKAGVMVKTYEKAGHLLATEYTREPIIHDVISFLG